MHVSVTHLASCFLWQIAAAHDDVLWSHAYSHGRLSTEHSICDRSQEASSFKLGRLCIVTLAVGKHISEVSTSEWKKLEQLEKGAMPARQALLLLLLLPLLLLLLLPLPLPLPLPLRGRQHDS